MKKDILIISDSTVIENTPRVNQMIGIIDLLMEHNIYPTLMIPKLKINIKDNFRYNLYKMKYLDIIEIKHCRIDQIQVISRKISSFLKRLFCKILPIDCLFIFSFVVFCKLMILNKKFNNIICIGNCLSVCFVGAIIKKMHKTNNFIMDMGDPFYSKNYINRIIEKFTTENADKVILPVSPMIHNFKYLKQNSIIMKQIFTDKFINYTVNNINKNSINLFYSGRFYQGMREPYALFDAINSLLLKGYKIRLYLFVIDFQEIFLKYLKTKELYNKSVFFKPIEREYLLGFMKQMTILINILNKNSNQFPSKLYDYQLAQKPILNIGYKDSRKKFKLVGEFSLNKKTEIEKKIQSIIENLNDYTTKENYLNNNKERYLTLLNYER